MGIFDDLFGNDKKKNGEALGFFAFLEEQEKYEKEKELEQKMEEYGLEEWQKDLVRSGEYNIDNFEEENLEEDDYYYEDK